MINQDRIESVEIYNGAKYGDDISPIDTSLCGYVDASFNELVEKLGRTILIDEWESDGKIYNEWRLSVKVEEQSENVTYNNPDFGNGTIQTLFISCHEDDVPLNTAFWHDTIEHEFIITIYDWKEPDNMVARACKGNVIYTWHVGCQPKYKGLATKIINDLIDNESDYIEVT